LIKCAYRYCEESFEPKRKNQKYCDTECCKHEMNARAKDSYAAKRYRILGNRRICNGPGCGAILSQYNEENKCTVCLQALEASRQKRLRDRVNGQDR